MSLSTPNIIEAGRITVKTDGIAQILRRLTIYTTQFLLANFGILSQCKFYLTL
jgi:hypothetical protein